jgi:hypothetical protein
MQHCISIFPPGSRHLLFEHLERRGFPYMERITGYINHVHDDMKQELILAKKGNVGFYYQISWDDRGFVKIFGDHVPMRLGGRALL